MLKYAVHSQITNINCEPNETTTTNTRIEWQRKEEEKNVRRIKHIESTEYIRIFHSELEVGTKIYFSCIFVLLAVCVSIGCLCVFEFYFFLSYFLFFFRIAIRRCLRFLRFIRIVELTVYLYVSMSYALLCPSLSLSFSPCTRLAR